MRHPLETPTNRAVELDEQFGSDADDLDPSRNQVTPMIKPLGKVDPPGEGS
jgi:hypothetical protein